MQSIDYSNSFDDINKKIDILQRLLKRGVIDVDLLRYLPAMLLLMFIFAFQKKVKTVAASDKATNMMTVNNFLAQWIREIDIKRYEDDLKILPTSNVTAIYRYWDAIFKHVPKDVLKIFEKKSFVQ